MDDPFVSIPVSETKNICLAPIAACDWDEGAYGNLGDQFGFFIFETRADEPAGGIEILGKLASREAAEKLGALLEEAAASRRLNRAVERYPTLTTADP